MGPDVPNFRERPGVGKENRAEPDDPPPIAALLQKPRQRRRREEVRRIVKPVQPRGLSEQLTAGENDQGGRDGAGRPSPPARHEEEQGSEHACGDLEPSDLVDSREERQDRELPAKQRGDEEDGGSGRRAAERENPRIAERAVEKRELVGHGRARNLIAQRRRHQHGREDERDAGRVREPRAVADGRGVDDRGPPAGGGDRVVFRFQEERGQAHASENRPRDLQFHAPRSARRRPGGAQRGPGEKEDQGHGESFGVAVQRADEARQGENKQHLPRGPVRERPLDEIEAERHRAGDASGRIEDPDGRDHPEAKRNASKDGRFGGDIELPQKKERSQKDRQKLQRGFERECGRDRHERREDRQRRKRRRLRVGGQRRTASAPREAPGDGDGPPCPADRTLPRGELGDDVVEIRIEEGLAMRRRGGPRGNDVVGRDDRLLEEKCRRKDQ